MTDHCLRSRNYVNVIIAGKQPELQWLDMDAAIRHSTVGIGVWTWASNDAGVEPDVLIPRLTYRRSCADRIHVRGYKEEGTRTTPFDMTVLNEIDRFHLAGDVIDRIPRLRSVAGHVKQLLRDKLLEHRYYVQTHGEDLPEVREWRWGNANPAARKPLD